MTPDCVNLVDENDARRRFLALLEHVAYARCADADKHLNEVRAADGKEWKSGSPRIGRRRRRLPVPRRPDRQATFCMRPPDFLNFFGSRQNSAELLTSTLSSFT